MNRIGLKISCLVVSIVIWFQVASTSVVEQRTSFPVRTVGLDSEYTLTGSDIPEEVGVVVRANKLLLLTHNYFNRYIGEVRIDLADREPGAAFEYDLRESDVSTDLVVLGIESGARPRLHVDRLVSRKLPVELVTNGELGDEYAFLESLRAQPDSLLATGPERFFLDDPVIRTATVELGTVDFEKIPEDGLLEVELVSPFEELALGATSVRAVVRFSRLVDRTLANIPVVPLVDAGLPEVGVSPPVADIMVRGAADSVQALDTSRFSVTVPVGSRSEGVYVLPGQVDHPDWLTFVRLDPLEFQVIVGNPPDDAVEASEASGESPEVPGE